MIESCKNTFFILIYKDIYLSNSLQSYFKKFIFFEFSATNIIHLLIQQALWQNIKNLSTSTASDFTIL